MRARRCGQCGKTFRARACGFTHAMLARAMPKRGVGGSKIRALPARGKAGKKR